MVGKAILRKGKLIVFKLWIKILHTRLRHAFSDGNSEQNMIS